MRMKFCTARANWSDVAEGGRWGREVEDDRELPADGVRRCSSEAAFARIGVRAPEITVRQVRLVLATGGTHRTSRHRAGKRSGLCVRCRRDNSNGRDSNDACGEPH